MPIHHSIKKSFFIRFLLCTIIVGNIYLGLQSLFHSFNMHFLDLYLRWYAFVAPSAYNIAIFIGTSITLYGAFKIWHNGTGGFRVYLFGKIIVLLGYIMLTWVEYQVAHLPYPYVLIPVILGLEAIYPMVLYLSLRKIVAKRSF